MHMRQRKARHYKALLVITSPHCTTALSFVVQQMQGEVSILLTACENTMNTSFTNRRLSSKQTHKIPYKCLSLTRQNSWGVRSLAMGMQLSPCRTLKYRNWFLLPARMYLSFFLHKKKTIVDGLWKGFGPAFGDKMTSFSPICIF